MLRTTLTVLASLALLSACAAQPEVRAPGPWTGKTFGAEIRHVGEHRFPETLHFDGGYRIEFDRNPQGRACSRVWQYDYLPNGQLAGPPQATDTCP